MHVRHLCYCICDALVMVNNLLQPLQVLYAYATPLLLHMRWPSHGQQPAPAAAGLHTVTELSRDRVVDVCGNGSVSCAPAGGRRFAKAIRCLL